MELTDKTFHIKGLEVEAPRREITNNLIYTIRDAGINKMPKIEVHNKFTYQGKELDAIIIKYHKDHIRPFYLERVYSSGGKRISAGAIYTRDSDGNTPIDRTAHKDTIEKMWREHFGIDKSAIEKMLQEHSEKMSQESVRNDLIFG